jgi:hypothetical protein
MLVYSLPISISHFLSQADIGGEAQYPLRQGSRIADRRQVLRSVRADRLPDARNISAHDREPCPHRLQDTVGKPLSPRAKNPDISCSEQPSDVVNVSKEPNMLFQAQLVRDRTRTRLSALPRSR